MNETNSEQTTERRQSDCYCGTLRACFEEAMDFLCPPESARNHFNQARIEFLRGVRDVVDQRIDRLSRTKPTGGTRVVVE